MEGGRKKKKKSLFSKIVWKTVKLSLIALSVFLASLFFRAQTIPRPLVEYACGRLSSDSLAVRCESASFGFRHGLSVSGVRIYDLEKEERPEDPVCTVSRVHVDVFERRAVVTGASYPRLPDSFYDDTKPPEPIGRLDFDLPEFKPFELVLERPSILGVEASRLYARVSPDGRRLVADGISLELPDRDCDTRVGGSLALDLDRQTISFSIAGDVKQSQVRPLLETLDAGAAVEYMDAFTEVEKPVESAMDFECDLVSGAIDLCVKIRPGAGKYKGAAFARAEGRIGFSSRIDGEKRVFALDIDAPLVVDPAGEVSRARITADDSSGRTVLGFDAKSALRFEDAVAVADIVPLSDLSMFRCDTHPVVTVKGTAGTSSADSDLNDLSGTLSLARGAIDGFVVKDLETKFTLKGKILESSSTATGKSGGNLSWSDRTDFSGISEGRARFSIDGSYRNGTLEEIADAFSFDLGERNGKIDWDLSLSGAVGTNDLRSLNGKGRVKVTEGHLAQMKLFAGLTKLLADKIPGVSFLVNQTQASADFTITNGVFETSNVYIEGGFFSIKGWGRYDSAADDLDFTVRAQFLKSGSIAGKIVHPITFPFTKLLLEFKVDGPIDDPRWRYISIPDRIF